MLMFDEVSPAALAAHAGRFPGPQLALVLASVVAGNTAARLWVERKGGEGAALLWDKGNNVFYLAGRRISAQAREELARLLATQIRQQALAEGHAYFKTRALAPELEGALAPLFGGIALAERDTLFYGLAQVPSEPPAPRLPGVAFALIDRALLERRDLENIDEVRSEIRWMWPSEERFCAQGFGYVALLDRRVVCWCTAEYLSPQQCGIGIQTEQAHQGRGVATATAARFVAECARRGTRPYWECAGANRPSIRVAEKVGFELIERTRFWVGAFG
jgi:RimJ/RimL family protein N-acetyltransferase